MDENIIGKWYKTPEAAKSNTAVPAYEFTGNRTLIINGEDVRTTWEIRRDSLILTTCGDKEKPFPFKIEKAEFLTLIIKCGLTAGTYYKEQGKGRKIN